MTPEAREALVGEISEAICGEETGWPCAMCRKKARHWVDSIFAAGLERAAMLCETSAAGYDFPGIPRCLQFMASALGHHDRRLAAEIRALIPGAKP